MMSVGNVPRLQLDHGERDQSTTRAGPGPLTTRNHACARWSAALPSAAGDSTPVDSSRGSETNPGDSLRGLPAGVETNRIPDRLDPATCESGHQTRFACRKGQQRQGLRLKSLLANSLRRLARRLPAGVAAGSTSGRVDDSDGTDRTSNRARGFCPRNESLAKSAVSLD
jgi:hypothetical protein